MLKRIASRLRIGNERGCLLGSNQEIRRIKDQ